MIRLKIQDPSGEWHTVEGDSKASITDQCEAKGIDSPFACRAGACTMCACNVQQGSEHLVQNKFGEKLIDIEENQFLCCIGGLNDASVESSEEHEVVLSYID